MFVLDIVKAICNVFEGCLPVDVFPHATLFDHGLSQPVVSIQGFVGKTIPVCDPAFVHEVIF